MPRAIRGKPSWQGSGVTDDDLCRVGPDGLPASVQAFPVVRVPELALVMTAGPVDVDGAPVANDRASPMTRAWTGDTASKRW